MVWMSNTQCSVNGADDSVDVEDTYSVNGADDSVDVEEGSLWSWSYGSLAMTTYAVSTYHH